MATTTPNFGWPVPTSTDLVKDGATAIEALGDGVDASLVDLKGGTTGQVLAKTSATDLDFTWVTTDDANAIQNSIVDAKGDLISATGNDTPARLAVGNNGETLVADSSTSTGLRYTGNFAAGKNAIINGDFNIWQRGTSFTATGGNFCADRTVYRAGATPTVSRQSFSIGDITGYNPQFFLRFVKGNTTADSMSIEQPVEDVRTFAGQTVTMSFWAKGSEAFTNAPLTRQVFGSGGSGDVYTTYTTQSITTSWARYSMTFTMPSVSGKTIGAGSYVSPYFIRYTGTSNITVDTWGWQLELGNTATAFQTATGTLQGELAACQRYYFRNTANGAYSIIANGGVANATTSAFIAIQAPVTMRVSPTSVEFSTLALYNGTLYAITTAALSSDSKQYPNVLLSGATGLTNGAAYNVITNNSTSGYIGFSAEL